MKPRVLAVDDDEGTRLLYAAGLGRKGYEVVTAADGLEALAMLETNVPDAVVLDIGMPNASGVAVTRWLRAHEHTASIPVVAVSGLAVVHESATDDVGWDAALTKPVDMDALAEVLAKLIVTKPRS